MEEPKNDPIGNYRQHVGSEQSSYRGMRDSVNEKLWEQAMRQEFEYLDNRPYFTLAELPKGRKAGRAE